MYEFNITLPLSLPEAQEKVTAAITAEKLGIVSEINVQAIALKKTGRDINPYLILGVCAPDLALQILDTEPNAGALLPCNVVLREPEARQTVVSFLSPHAVLGLAENDALIPVADAALERLEKAKARL